MGTKDGYETGRPAESDGEDARDDPRMEAERAWERMEEVPKVIMLCESMLCEAYSTVDRLTEVLSIMATSSTEV